MWFWVSIIAVLVLVAYFILRQESDSTGGDFNTFVKKPSSSSSVGSPKPKKAKDPLESCDEVYQKPGRQVLILYGTAYGFAELLSKKLYRMLRTSPEDGSVGIEPSLNVQPRLVNMKDWESGYVELEKETFVMLIVSTAGDGVPPSDARDFYDFLQSNKKLSLAHLQVAVLALGDTSYPHFCRCGKEVDKRLQEMGAQQVLPRVDVDKEEWPKIDAWMSSLIKQINLSFHVKPEMMDYLSAKEHPTLSSSNSFSRTNPFEAILTKKYCLTKTGQPDDKEIFHMEFDLSGSGLSYTSGDAIGIVPLNHPSEVEAMLRAWGRTGKEKLFAPRECSLRETLLSDFDLKQIKTSFLTCLLRDCAPPQVEASKLQAILEGGDNKDNKLLQEFLHHREILDVLLEFPKSARNLTLRNCLAHLRPLQPRYYSISSSPLLTPEKPNVTAAVVRYEMRGIKRTGVCTTYLADRVKEGEIVRCFYSKNMDFRLPTKGETPIIMVGPGTGLAPFRAFVQERIAQQCRGAMRLYFGCRYRSRDYMYSDELEGWATAKHIQLRVAFSREQEKKVYVQHLIEEDGEEIASLLSQGAHFYICGDGNSMSNDVTSALERVLIKHMKQTGVKTQQQAKEFVQKMEEEGRFQKDVWIT